MSIGFKTAVLNVLEFKLLMQGLCAGDGLYLLRASVHQAGAALGVMRTFTSACSLVDSGMVSVDSRQ